MPIYIVGAAAADPTGRAEANRIAAYRTGRPCFQTQNGFWVANLTPEADARLAAVGVENDYRSVDKSVLLAVELAREAFSALPPDFEALGINVGSSRGATRSWEATHADFHDNPRARLSPHTSPATTLGNLSSWIGYDLQAETTAAFSHSITCSTSAYALGNAFAWLNAGMCDVFLSGGVETSLTDFTLAQLRSLNVCARAGRDENANPYPCRPFGAGEANTMVLAEGGALFALVNRPTPPPNMLARLEAFGFGNERFPHPAALTPDAECVQKAMRRALSTAPNGEPVDLIIAHGNGTLQGDAAEWKAIQAVFQNKIPPITSTKWLTGHTLGASAAVSLAYALRLLAGEPLTPLPYPNFLPDAPPGPIRKILINSVGFGANAASILISNYY